MNNVQMKVTGNKLTIEVDLTKQFGSSKSGKNILVASTKGNADVPGKEGLRIGLNVYKKANGSGE